jgi:hypothetical protein
MGSPDEYRITAEFLLVHGDDIAELPQDSWSHLFAVLAKGIQGSLFKITDKLREDLLKLRPVKIEPIAMTRAVGLLHLFDQRLQPPELRLAPPSEGGGIGIILASCPVYDDSIHLRVN